MFANGKFSVSGEANTVQVVCRPDGEVFFACLTVPNFDLAVALSADNAAIVRMKLNAFDPPVVGLVLVKD